MTTVETPARSVEKTSPWLVALVALVVTLVLVTGGWLLVSVNRDSTSNTRILHLIETYTNPSSKTVKAEQQGTIAIENRVIICTDNHLDRALAIIFHTIPPPLFPGCP